MKMTDLAQVIKALEDAGWVVARMGGEASWTDTKQLTDVYYLAIWRSKGGTNDRT